MTKTNIYTPPAGNDSAGFFELFRYVNNTADGTFFLMILGIIWVVAFMASKQYSTSRAFTVASFISAILSIPLAVMGLLASKFMYLSIILVGVGAVWLKLESN